VGSLESETEVDLAVLGKTSGDGGIPHGELLNNFVDATLSFDAAATTERRKLLRQAIGDDGLVDAAAVAAMFQLNTRAADAAGVSVEAATLEGRERIGASLGFASRDMGEAP
jgi:hypothetical protein|tara:strand:- start:181 stop:516 length:336 start_codon:yes stop_codon:yes gene_type:complete